MKKTFSILLVLSWICALAGCASSQPGASSAAGSEKPAETEFYAMDTVMQMTAYGDGAQTALDDSQQTINNLEDLLSRTREDSEVSKINAAGAGGTTVSPTTTQLLSAAIDYAYATDGAFDVTVAPVVSAWGFTTDHYQVPSQAELDSLLPLVDYTKLSVANQGDSSGDRAWLGAGQSIDLGGIAKGYASDCVANLFAENGVGSGMVYLGGNVYVCGTKPDGSLWRVAVQDPDDTEGWVGVLNLTDAFAITSGGYQRYFEENGKRYHHIIDPKTGYPAEGGLISVTVVATAHADGVDLSAPGNGTMCDAFSTALFVMGTDKALDFWRSSGYDFDLVLVTEDGRVLVTGGIADEFEENEDSNYTYEIIR